MRRRLALAAPVLGILSLQAGSPAANPQEARYPDPEWARAEDLRAHGTSRERLDAYGAWLAEHGGLHWAAVVVKKGALVYEGRGPRSHVRQKNDCGSILKPLQATVLGAALAQGRLRSLDENAIPYWKDPHPTPYENDRVISFRQFAQYKDRWNSKEPPGTFHYNNAGATAAGACIAGLFMEVRGPRPRGIAEVARKEVMERIGASWDLWYWEQPFSGDTGNPGPRMVLESDVSELAKLGYLWLRRGRWKERVIFTEDYYREAVTDASPDTGNTSFGYFGHYGFWWFVNSKGVLLPEVPEDAFYAIGNGSPKRATCLLVIPSQDIVAVLGMERVSDEGKWDVIKNSRVPANDGPRLWAREVARLHAAP
jgi:CubicO group peptidase (beta-lactamase class C family)